MWRLDEGETFEDARSRVDALANTEVPSIGSGLDAAESLVAIVNPFGSSQRLLLGVDLEPGTYVMAAIDQEEDGAEVGPTPELIEITVS